VQGETRSRCNDQNILLRVSSATLRQVAPNGKVGDVAREETAENTSDEPIYGQGWLSKPGAMLSSTCIHAGTSTCIHVASSQADRDKEGGKSHHRRNTNSLWERVDSCVTLVTSIIVAGAGISGVLRDSILVAEGAKLDMSDALPLATGCKPVSTTPRRTPGCYSKGFMPCVKRGSFVL